jgi:hypothetical protein
MNSRQWISWWWRRKGLPTSITVLSRKRWKNYGAAIVAWLAALMSTTGFAFAEATTSTDCGTSPSCVSMGDASSKDNAVSQINPVTASNGNDLGNDNTVKTNITGGNTTSTGGTTTSTGGTNTATGGTYTTGALNAGGATVGNTDNASSATTGASSSSIGNTSTGGNSLTGGTQTAQTGASTSSTGAVTVNPNNTNGQSLADNSTRNTASQATGGSVGNTSAASNQSLNGGATTVKPTQIASTSAKNSAETGSNTSVTNVDAADRSTTNYRSVALVLPSVGVTAPSTVAVGNIIKETMACGVLQSVQRDPVKGTYMGLFKRSQIDLGTDDSLVPFTNETGEEVYYKRVLGSDGKYRLMGHQPIIYTTVLSVSGARNLSLGGRGSQQEWGQAGVGASSAMNRLVSKIQLRSCEMAVEQVPTVARIKQ